MNPCKKYRGIAMLLLIVGLGISSLGLAAGSDDDTSIKEIQQETRELLQALKSYTVEQRDEAIRKIKAAQENLDRRIEMLEQDIAQNWDKMDGATREKSRASLKALRQQRTEVAEYYGSLKTSSAAAWGHMKQGFSSAYRALHDAWEKAEEEFVGDE